MNDETDEKLKGMISKSVQNLPVTTLFLSTFFMGRKINGIYKKKSNKMTNRPIL